MTKKRKRSQRRTQPRQSKNYRTERYVEYIFAAEVGVLQAATTLPELTDGEALDALRKLVARVRSDGLPRLQEQPEGIDGLIVWLIVSGWQDLFHRKRRLSKRDMAGCLNVVIESVETRMRSPQDRRYLKYLKRFMKRAGVTIRAKPVSELEDEEQVPRYDLERMSLAELGELLLSEVEITGLDEAFESQVSARIASGKADEVVTICRGLLDQTAHLYIRMLLYNALGTAYHHLGDLEQAVAMFEATRSSDVTDANVLDKLAETYRELGRYEEAIEIWRECLVDPGSAAYFYSQIVRAYRQMGDLAGEEVALRSLIEVDRRGGCLLFGWGARPSLTALGQLAGCLRRQEREAEARSLSARIRRRRPSIRAETMVDWAYWVREWMLAGKQDVPLDRLARFDGQEPGRLHWIPVLRAVLFDQMGRSQAAEPYWRIVQDEFVGKPDDWMLDEIRNMMRDLVPASSRLFE